ncbi:DNA polymerase III subunit beta [Blochmannia endosymbiont of Colobopsis nipponica]|uniref:DNA polymerase III subunit beta n=1 Tax=Blochmannia endosymbiont of Colobopsis nipponica TaxID=2681987 RepID=UPI001784FF52|nr:DNA polymerase III subunit beta [Blochmannia endosymbiont of Colobopsis nipponica]QOI10829.1 DNA polymerase III subunit beta [Blochmannia endosymbiont of Colobopsis nipponica]
MYCTIDRNILLRSLQYIVNILKGRMTLPILNNILLEIKNDRLYLISTDLEVEMIAIINLSSESQSGLIAVAGRKLFDICRALPERVNIFLHLQQDRLLIRSEHSSFLLSTIRGSDFPNLENYDYEVECIIQKQMLKKLIESTYFSMSNQDVRYCLNGMLFEIFEKKIRTVATDGHRLALCTIPIDALFTSFYSIIIPRKGVFEILRMLGNKENQVKLQISNHSIRVGLSNYILTSKLIDVSFPDYHCVFPEEPFNIFEVERKILQEACTRIAILSNERFHGIRLFLSLNKLKITANNSIYEEAEETIDVVYQNDEIEIGFNVNYLLDVLNIIKSQNVKFFIKDELSSVKIESCSDKTCIYFIMPMKL